MRVVTPEFIARAHEAGRHGDGLDRESRGRHAAPARLGRRRAHHRPAGHRRSRSCAIGMCSVAAGRSTEDRRCSRHRSPVSNRPGT
ncbi:MAG: hypothetical protein M0C28_16635 [Candidatus Moduliflexus flocculans]|nr:hypothetical protein [Candidatus Moduliflexus flocculans]